LKYVFEGGCEKIEDSAIQQGKKNSIYTLPFFCQLAFRIEYITSNKSKLKAKEILKFTLCSYQSLAQGRFR
jgi:hypothetical protein